MALPKAFPLIFLLLAGAALTGQEFEFGISAPEAILQNSTFEVSFTITSRGIPPGQKGTRAWTMGVAHQGLRILSAKRGTIVQELLSGGFATFEITTSRPEHPENDGFICGVLLSMDDPDITLPPEGTFTVARATYHADALACSQGARIAMTDGLQGSGQPIKNVIALGTDSYFPPKVEKAYAGCEPNDYLLHFSVPESPVPLHLGERKTYLTEVRLGQAASTASGWGLAVAHDDDRFQLVEISIQGTPVEDLLSPTGFALFEITSGRGNAGFTAQVELSMRSPWALPAPDQAIVRCRYEMRPIFDPGLIGSRIASDFRFASSLRGSGGLISNQVFPAGNLTKENAAIKIDVLPLAKFLRGDSNGDGEVNISDPLAILFHLFEGSPSICLEAGNSNDDAWVDLTDVVFILERLFLAGQDFPHPSPGCGTDPSLPSLGCEVSACP